MAQQINISDTATLIPSGYSSANSSYSSISSDNPVTNGYTDANSTSYAYITCNTGSRATTYISYTFDVSEIPAEATIDSVACSAKGRVSSTSYISTAVFQLYANTTAKGSSTSARTTTATVYTLTPGTWTRSELENIQIRYTGTRGNSNTSRAAYLYFYGATLTINYTISGMQYTVTATSSIPSITVEPATQALMEGEDIVVIINADDLTDYKVTDNDTDITSLLVKHQGTSGTTTDTISATAESLTTGFSGGSNMNFYTSSSSTGHNFDYAVGHTAESPGSTGSGSGTWTYVKANGNSTSETGYADFVFDFSDIPVNASITNVEVRCYGAVESASQSTSHADITLFSGNTQKGTMQKFTRSSNSIITISDPGTWTRAELQEAKLRFAVGYYGGHIYGITWEVEYSIYQSTDTYYTYEINDIDNDHIIFIEEKGAYIPPEEDPEYTYQSITISSINATTNPGTGTTRVIEGSNQTITITPTDPQLTLALDNGVDITNQLQGGIPNNTYTITTQVSGASYGFNLNSSTGYYVSTNNGVSKSASVARINLDLESACIVTIQYINYAEASYDYGMFGKLDTAVATDGLTASSGSSSPSDSTSNYQIAMCSNSSSAQTVTYEVPAGEHFIDVKYGKDDATNSNNDTLQWKITSVEATSAGSNSYTYTLTNVTQKHSLIFVFGDVTYYFVESSGTDVRLFPDGQQVILPGNNYEIDIVPNNTTDTITITDNNVNVTSSLVRKVGTDKQGNPAVSYEYTLTNVSAAHTIVVTGTPQVTNQILYTKQNGEWEEVIKVWKKEDDRWTEVAVTYFNTNNIKYLKKGKTIKQLIPSTYALSNTSYLSIADATNMYHNTENESYATISHTRASTSYSYYLYLRGFDFSQIPNDANIESFTIRFKARESGLSTSASYVPSLINNTTAITGTASAVTTTATTTAFTGVSATWATIKGYGSNFGIRFTLRRSSANTTGYLYVYGVELEVVYS